LILLVVRTAVKNAAQAAGIESSPQEDVALNLGVGRAWLMLEIMLH
jgi:hypothetical protein